MQLGKSLVGALLGAVVGVILLIAVHMQWGLDRNWLAIPVAILTGLGVRALATTYGHESYLRGAITALIALGAFMFGMDRAAKIAVSRAVNANAATLPEVTAPPLEGVGATDTEKPTTDPATPADPNAAAEDAAKSADAAEQNDAAADATPTAKESAQQVAKPPASPAQNVDNVDNKILRPNPAQQPSTLDYVWLAVAGLVAYQLGRGSAIDPRMAGNMVAPPDAT
jgi:hypothetical protein